MTLPNWLPLYKALLRVSFKALLRLYEGSFKALLRLRRVWMTLPNWLPLVHSALPASLYTPRLREALETLVVYWMAFSGLWALWQVVLCSLHRAFIEP